MKTTWPKEVRSHQIVKVGLRVYRLRESSGGVLGGEHGLPLATDRAMAVRVKVRRAAPGSPVEVQATVTPHSATSPALRAMTDMPAWLAAEVETAMPEAVKARIELEAAARLARSKRQVAFRIPRTVHVELHFPVQDRLATLAETVSSPRVDEAGRIVLGDPASVLCENFPAVMARGGPKGEAAPDLLFAHRARFEPGEAAVHVQAFLESQGWMGPLPEFDGNAGHEVTCLVRLAGRAVRSWLTLPSGRHSMAFHDRIKHGLCALQRALRLWIGYEYFQDCRRYLQRGKSWPVLVYAAMRPATGRRMYDYSVDTLDPARLNKALRATARPLRAHARIAQQRLLAIGEELPRIVEVLPIRSREKIVKVMSICPAPRTFSMLVNGEARLAEAVAAQGHLTSRYDADPRYLRRQGLHFHRVVSIQMARMTPHYSFRHFTPLVYLAASWGLALGSGSTPKLELLIRVRDLETGQEKWSSSDISYEKSRRRKPL